MTHLSTSTHTATLHTTGQPTDNQGRTEIAFVLDNVADWQTLAEGVRAGVEVVLLDSRGDGLAQMADWLAQKEPGSVDAIHLLSHGSSGAINLGALTLNSENLQQHNDTLTQIGNVLTADGDFLVYGCSVAEGRTGVEFVGKLAQATGADVGASDDLTGASGLGGDGVLEEKTGALSPALTLFQNYSNVLSLVGAKVWSEESFLNATEQDAATIQNDPTAYELEPFGPFSANIETIDATHSKITMLIVGTSWTDSDVTSYMRFTGGVLDRLTSVSIDSANTTSPNITALSIQVNSSDPKVLDFTYTTANAVQTGGQAGQEGKIRWNPNDVIVLNVTSEAVSSDLTAPTLDGAHSTPADDATSIAVGSDIVIDFSENIAFGSSGTITVRNVTDNSTAGTFTVTTGTASGAFGTATISSDKLTINPTSDLVAGKTYAVQFSAGSVVDTASTPNTLAAISDDTTYNFGTARNLFTLSGQGYDEFQTVTDGSTQMSTDATEVGTGSPVTVTFGSVPLGTTTAAFDSAMSNLYGDATVGDLVFVPTLRDQNNSYNDESSLIIESLTHSFDFKDFTYYANFESAGNNGTYTIKGYYNSTLIDTVVINATDGLGTAASSIGSKFTGNGKQVTRVIIEASDGTAASPYNGYNHFDMSDFTPLSASTTPTLTATGATPTFTQGSATGVDLFSTVAADTNDNGQTFTGAKFTVTNVYNTTEYLTIGGIDVALTDGGSTALTGLGATASVAVTSGVATVTITGLSRTNAEMGTLIDGVTYKNTDAVVKPGNRVITLTEVTDSGSSSNLASLSGITATVAVSTGGAPVDVNFETYFDPGSMNLAIGIAGSAGLTASGIYGWNFTVTSSDSAANFHVMAQDPFLTTSIALQLYSDVSTAPITSVRASAKDGSEFKLNSLQFSTAEDVTGNTFSITLTGYRDGVAVSGATVTVTAGENTLEGFDVSANTNFQNIDEFRLTAESGTIPTFYVLDTIDIAPAVTSSSPTITSATYNASTNVLTVTGTDLTSGGAIDETKLTLTGQGGATYTLTETGAITAASTTSFSVTLNATDQAGVEALLNKNGTSAYSGTAYNLAAAANWHGTGNADVTDNAVTVSNAPVLAGFEFATGTAGGSGGNITWTETVNGTPYTLSMSFSGYSVDPYWDTSDAIQQDYAQNDQITVSISISGYTFGVSSISFQDLDGTAGNNLQYSITGSAGALASGNWNGDLTGEFTTHVLNNFSGTTSNLSTLSFTIGSSTMAGAWAVPQLILYDITPLPAGTTPTLTATGATPTFTQGSATGVDLFSTVAADTNDSGQTFSGAKITVTNVADTTEYLTIGGTNVALTNAASGTIASVGSYSVAVSGSTATITLSGMTQSNANMGTLIDGITYKNSDSTATAGNRVVTLTEVTDSGSSNATASLSGVAATVAVTLDSSNVTLATTTSLQGTGSADVSVLNGSSISVGSHSYNAPPDDFMGADAGYFYDITNFDPAADKISLLFWGKTNSEVTITIDANSSAWSDVFDAWANQGEYRIFTSPGYITAAGFTGPGSAAITAGAAVTGTSNISGDISGTFVMLCDGSNDITTVFLRGITSTALSNSNFIIEASTGPAITSATYNASTNVLTVTGTDLTSGGAIDETKLTLTGQGGATYTLTETGAITAASTTSFSVTLNATDQAGVEALLNKNGTSAYSGTAYNLAAAANWHGTGNVDATGNAVTVSNANPSATFDFSTDTVTGTSTAEVKQTLSSGAELIVQGIGGTLVTDWMSIDSTALSYDLVGDTGEVDTIRIGAKAGQTFDFSSFKMLNDASIIGLTVRITSSGGQSFDVALGASGSATVVAGVTAGFNIADFNQISYVDITRVSGGVDDKLSVALDSIVLANITDPPADNTAEPIPPLPMTPPALR